MRTWYTQPAPCGEPSCSNGGIAIGAYLGGAIDLRGFQIARAALCGVHVAEDGSLDLHDGAVSDSAIGACVQVDGYDLSRLTDGVRFESNGTNLETTMLPIPTPISAF